MTDAEWALMAPHLPAPRMLGRPRTTDLRAVVNAIFHMLRAGCPWRLLPREFPPRSTVPRHFHAWRVDGTCQSLNHPLLVAARAVGGAGGQPERRHRRQPVGQDPRKRRPARLR